MGVGGVAGFIAPAGIGVRRLLGNATALIEEAAHRLLQHIVVDVAVDAEIFRTGAVEWIEDIVFAAIGDLREVEPPCLVAGCCVSGAILPRG